MKKLIPFILIILVLNACNQSNNESNNVKVSDDFLFQSMPKDMPEDFGFSVQFGVDKKNKIDTFNDKIIKDLIADGTATATFTFSDEELSEIYHKMKEINVLEAKNFIPEPSNVCELEPYEADEWKITFNGETITHSLSGAYCEPTKDTKQLLELRDYVFSIVKNKDEYLQLPESNGGYD